MLRLCLFLLLALAATSAPASVLPGECSQRFWQLAGTPASNFTSAEQAVLNEVKAILRSPELVVIRQAYIDKVAVSVKVGRRLIQYEPGLPASGMTMFGEDGFLVGREAFVSEEELQKTLLHETYRLHMSQIGRGAAASQEGVANETAAAFSFAERAYNSLSRR